MITTLNTEESKQKVAAFKRRYWRYRTMVKAAGLLPVVLLVASLVALGNFHVPAFTLLIVVGIVGLIGLLFFQELRRPSCPNCDRALSARSASDWQHCVRCGSTDMSDVFHSAGVIPLSGRKQCNCCRYSINYFLEYFLNRPLFANFCGHCGIELRTVPSRFERLRGMHSHGKVTDPQHFEHSVGKLLYPNSRLGLANLTFVLTCFATAHLIFNPWAPFYGILQKTSLLRSIEVGTFLLTLFISVSWARNETDKIAKQFIWIVALVVAILTSITVPALVTFSFANEQVSFEDTVLDVNRSAGRTIASLKLESDKDVTLHPNRSTVRKFNKGAVVKIRGYRSARFGTYVTEVVGKE